MSQFKLIGILSLCVVLGQMTGYSTAFAAVRNVPAQYATIQAGIQAAVNGDTVLIANGTYMGTGNMDIDVLGKAITIKSSSGPTLCIIECNVEGRGFYLHNGEGSATVIEGITIRNGWDLDNGGAICCIGASPIIKNCILRNNYARNQGGGAVYCGSSSHPTIANCTISNNSADTKGAGICCVSSSSIIVDNVTFNGNTTLYSLSTGGGMYCEGTSSPTVVNSLFQSNVAPYGGGLYCKNYSPPTIFNCVFISNTATTNHGGGIYCEGHTAPAITNCTILNNSAGINGGGVKCVSISRPVVKNSILRGNSPDQIISDASYPPIITYTDIQGGYAGAGNIDANPLFVTGPSGAYYLSQILSGQSSNSPCLNGGEALARDTYFPGSSGDYCMKDFTTRTDQTVDGGVCDIGFHYFPTSYVPPTATPWQPPVPASSSVGLLTLGILMGVLIVLKQMK